MQKATGPLARSLIAAYVAHLLPPCAQIMVHLYNSGFEPICEATLSLSETAEVEQAWTVEQVRAPSIERFVSYPAVGSDVYDGVPPYMLWHDPIP